MFSPHSRLRHAAADTFAMVVYCFVVGMIIEIFISGMTFEQSLSSRLVSIPVNILIAWPYGIYRDAFKPRRCAGVCDLPVSCLCRHSAVCGRGLASDRGRGQFKRADLNADGRSVRVFS